MKITVESCDVFLVGVPQIFDRVKSVALWSAKKKKISNKTIKGYGSAATTESDSYPGRRRTQYAGTFHFDKQLRLEAMT